LSTASAWLWPEVARWHLQLEIILRAVTAEFGLTLHDLEK
jgi:hypothetical protein